MKNSPRCLLLTALCLTTVACSSAQPTVRVSPPIPHACLVNCEPFPTAPPVHSERLDDWLSWGDDATADYEACRRLKADCTAILLQAK